MEERIFDISINHYRSRLLATILGNWISFTRDCRQRIAECEAVAIQYHWKIVMQSAVFKLKWMKYSLNKRRFDTIMGNVMNRLIKLRKGMCWFRMFIQNKVSKKRHQRLSRICKNEVYIEMTKSSSNVVRMLNKFKGIVNLRSRVTAVICNSIVQSSDCSAVEKRRELVRSVVAMLKSMVSCKSQCKDVYQRAVQLCRQWCRRRHFDKLKSLVLSKYQKHEQVSWLCKHSCLQLLRLTVKRLRRQRTVAVQNTSRIQGLDQWAQRSFYRAALRRLWLYAHRDRTAPDQATQLARHALATASRRALGRMLRLVKQRYIMKYQVRSKLMMFLLHVRHLRLKSAAVAQWQCHFIKACRLGARRMKIADFQLRYRTLKMGFETCRSNITALARQRHSLFDGKYALYRKSAMRGVGQLQRFCLKGKQAAIRDWRAVLFWKFWRGCKAIRQLRDNALQRRSKRLMLQDARAANALRERKEACVEFLTVAFPHTNRTNFTSLPGHAHYKHNGQLYLAQKVVCKWRAFVRRKHQQRLRSVVLSPPPPPATLPFAPNRATADQRSSTRSTSSSAVVRTLAESDGFGAQIAVRAVGTASREVTGLSRARPRSEVPTSVPLPQPHKSEPLEFRFNPAALCSQHEALDKQQQQRPYRYLSVGTALPRPPYPSTLSAAAVLEQRCEPYGRQGVSGTVCGSRAPPRCGTENVLRQGPGEGYERLQDPRDVASELQPLPAADSSVGVVVEAKPPLVPLSLDPAEDAELRTLLAAAQTSKFSSATQDLLRALVISPNIRLES